MAGLNVGGWGNFPGQPQNTRIANPAPAPVENSGVNTGPSKPQGFRGPAGGGGINIGRTSLMGALPSVGDPFRTYGTVEGGRVIPPSNPYGQNQPIRFTPGGEYGGGGPGPSPQFTPPSMPSPQDYMNRGGFTGGQMPPDVQSGSAGASIGPSFPPGMRIPSRNPNPPGGGRGQFPPMRGRYTDPNNASIPDMQQGNPMANRGFRGAYGGAGASLPNVPFRNNLFY